MISESKYRQLLLMVSMMATNITALSGQQLSAGALQIDSIKVLATTQSFLSNFRNLEWDAFAQYFVEDATAFFPPSAKQPKRADNKTAILAIFKVVFDNARKGRTQPPYLDIDPKDIRIQMLGQVAIVSFTLNDPDMLSRRTIVWIKRKDSWKIIHLHASGIALVEK